MAFFRKADAKVRTFSESPKLFRSFFKSFFEAVGSSSCPFVQYFNSSAFLSRKRMQNYCFTTYLPNVCIHFFQTFCKLFANSLICRHVLQQFFWCAFDGLVKLYLNINTRIYMRIHIDWLTDPSPCSHSDGKGVFAFSLHCAIQTTGGRKDLGNIRLGSHCFVLPRSFASLWMTIMGMVNRVKGFRSKLSCI